MRTSTLLLLAALCTTLPRAALAADERPADTRPVREQRRFMIGAELAWNGLAGFGLNASYHVLSHLAFDAGVGLSTEGLKTGLRARVNLLDGSFTPFAAAGILYGFGSAGREATANLPSGPVTFTIGPSPFAQLVAGLDYTNEEGFTFLLTAGYAVLLRKNLTVTSGTLDATGQSALDITIGSGIVVGIALGYSF